MTCHFKHPSCGKISVQHLELDACHRCGDNLIINGKYNRRASGAENV